jgi:nitrogen PTS system EIIA component
MTPRAAPAALGPGRTPVDIEHLLSPADVIVGLRAPDKRAALQALTHHLAAKLNLSPKDVLSAVLRREELGSTGLGNGVAVSHARLDAVTRPAGVLARLKHPIAFEAIDGHPVDLVCLLLLPVSPQGAQLQALACVARTLRDADVLVRTRRAGDSDAVFAALTSKAA